MAILRFTVNGKAQSVDTVPERPLLEVLREDLHITGVKYGCGEGQCRACTVLLNGRAVPSCMIPASAALDKSVTTIEGLAARETLHPVQAAFLEEGTMQCGYCIPGMILTAAAFLERTPHPTEEQIIEGMNANLCRCCGYPRIIAAVRRASDLRSQKREGTEGE